jgi:hypothetical protein
MSERKFKTGDRIQVASELAEDVNGKTGTVVAVDAWGLDDLPYEVVIDGFNADDTPILLAEDELTLIEGTN